MERKRYVLLQGRHIQQDYTQPPRQRFNESSGEMEPVISMNRTTGAQYYEYPSRLYTPGEQFDNDVDLVARHGAEKFRCVGPAKTQAEQPKGSKRRGSQEDDLPTPEPNPCVAPGGQVSTGHQATTAGVPGPQPIDSVEEEGAESEKPESLTADLSAVPVPPAYPRQPDGRPLSQREQDEKSTLGRPGLKGKNASRPEPKKASNPEDAEAQSSTAPKAAARTEAKESESREGKSSESVQSHVKTRKKKYSRSDLEKHTVRDLKSMAHDEEIDLEGATTKEDIIDKFDPSDD